MNLRSLVVVVLRLMALEFLLQVVVQLTPKVLQYLSLYQASQVGNQPSVLPWLVLAGLVISALLLWFMALPIARLVTRPLPQEISLGALTLADCYSVAFIGVGLLYIANGLPQVLNWGHYLFKAAASTSGDSWKEQVNFYQVSQAFIPFILGALLFFKGRPWAVALASRQTKAESPNPLLEPTSAAGGSQGESDVAGGGSRGSA
jgi:hypothetical protein